MNEFKTHKEYPIYAPYRHDVNEPIKSGREKRREKRLAKRNMKKRMIELGIKF